MRRREFLGLLCSSAALGFPAARADGMPVIGFLNASSKNDVPERVRAFLQGLQSAGYEDGRNVAVVYRWANNDFSKLRELAEELVGRNVNVIVSGFNLAAARAAKEATTTIPVVFASGVDPVKEHLVATLNRPGGNVTGVNILTNELVPKHLEVLHETLPQSRHFGVLINPANKGSADSMAATLRDTAGKLELEISIVTVGRDEDLEKAFPELAAKGVAATIITPDAFFSSRDTKMATLALQHSMPTISSFRAYASAGGLMSYGGSTTEQARQVGIYVARILKGEKAGDLPVFQATTVDFVINLKTAKALKLSIPLPLLGRADEVIE